MPKLSFVIPYWKKEKSIAKCLKHLYAQSMKDFEVILVKDGPDDSVDKILKRFKKLKVIEIAHGGAPAARNAGAALATGEFISFWDADCYIESGAAEVWMQVFRKYPDADFCYSGYKFYPEGLGAINGEPFDPWLLEINNYISGMFPIKREKAPRWDESLKSLQDWDFWLQSVKAGCKGFYIRGYGFKTDYPVKGSISGEGCRPEHWLERLETVKKKHGIPLRELCISSLHDRETGIELAKLIGADYRDYPTYLPNRYKTILQIGFHPKHADVHAGNFKNGWSKSKRILFWRAVDVHALKSEASIESTEALATLLNASVDKQFCEDHSTAEKMKRMGFKVEILTLPIDASKDEIKPMPSELRVLMDNAQEYRDLFDHIQRAMPDVKFDDMKGAKESADYSVMVHFQPDRAIDMNVKKMLLNGRYIISNIQAPHCGYVSGEKQTVEEAREEIIRELRRLHEVKEVNQAAIDWYRVQYSPQKFKDSMTKLEVLKEPEAVAA